MNNKKLTDILKDIKQHRRLSSESEAILAPFIGQSFSLVFRFLSTSRTFTNRFDSKYSNGQTLIAEFVNEDLECSIIFSPSKNQWVEALEEKEEFECDVIVLELDNLYQRVVLGQLFDNKPEDEIGHEAEPLTEPSSVENEKKVIEESKGEKASVHAVPVENNKPEDNFKSIDEKKKESTEGLPLQASEEEVNKDHLSDGKKDDLEPEQAGEVNIAPPTFKSEENLDNKKENNSLDQLQVDSVPDLLNPTIEGESKPPPIPSLPLPKEKQELDYIEVERIRDKRYEYGADSLTSEEKEILIQDRVQNASSRKKNLEESQNILNKGSRLLFGIVLGMVGLRSLVSGSFIFGVILLAVTGYLLMPFIIKSE